jgi:hypothetical protein
LTPTPQNTHIPNTILDPKRDQFSQGKIKFYFMKVKLSLDDLARNCQGFGALIAANITFMQISLHFRDVILFTSLNDVSLREG